MYLAEREETLIDRVSPGTHEFSYKEIAWLLRWVEPPQYSTSRPAAVVGGGLMSPVSA